MKHKTLFRLALNVIGVLLIALALPELIKDVAGFIRTYRLQGSTAGWAAPMSMTEHLFWLTIAPLMQIGIGAYLLSGAPLVVEPTASET